MRKQACGFTLVEIIIVLVILGIVAVLAMPKLMNYSTTASRQTLNSVAGALNAASATNHTLSKSGASNAVSGINDCNEMGNALPASSPLPDNVTIESLELTPNASATCTVTDNYGNSATFIGWGTS
jgi:MSHA pilin protein MshA